jgi:hypothetical protein
MGPTKVLVKASAIYEAKTGKIIKDGLTTPEELQDYANHHYISLPGVDKGGQPWLLDGEPIYYLRGTRFGNLKDEVIHLTRCPDCGGMGIRDDEPMVESDCIRCMSCDHEFDTRLEMMES